MTKYLLPMARNVSTGQTIKTQDLTGYRFSMSERFFCEEKAKELAQKLSNRTGESWIGFVKEYLPSKKIR